MNVNLVKILSQSVVVAISGAALSACAFNPPSADSPLAPTIDALVAENNAYPRWQDFPAAPVDVPQDSEIRAAVTALEGAQQVHETQLAAVEWELGDAEEFVASVKERQADDGVEVPTINTPAEIEAFAASLRERAKAPPAVDRPMR